MSQTLVKTIADFSTTLVSKTAVGATTATLTSGLDADGVQLPTGTYGFTIDRNNSSKEHFTATLTGAELTAIKTVTRGTGAGTSGLLRTHRKGAEVIITDHVAIKRITNLLDGTTSFDSGTPLGYDGTASITTQNQFATKAYADTLAIAGAPTASTTVQGLVEEATQAEVDARTTTGGTGAKLFAPLDKIRASLYHDYAADAGANDTYAVTITPAPTAYTTGMVIVFKANTVNTGACTINVNSLGAKSLKMNKDLDPVDGYIKAGADVMAVYDGTNFQILSVSGKPSISQTGGEVYAASTSGNDTYAITLVPAPTAYATGMVVRAKVDTANTGAATMNVNSLGAITIKKNVSSDLETGDILANQIIELIYDGTNFQLLTTTPSAIRTGIFNNVPNTNETSATWFTFEMPILTLASTTTVGGWGLAGFATVTAGQGASYQTIGLSNNGGRIYTPLAGSAGTSTGFKFSSGKKWKAKFYSLVSNSTNVWGIGILEGTSYTEIYDAETDTSSSRMRLVFNSSTTYLANSNGTNYTANTVSVTRTNWNLYELYFDGSSLYCYVNGTLAATNSTNLPTSSANECYFVIGGDTISTSMSISPITFSLEL